MAKLINYQYLRTEVDISQNVPDMELDTPIRRAQEMLSMVIGEELYTELDAQHPNFSATNTPLMVHVKKFLAWQAYVFWMPKANFKTHASGYRVHEEENSRAANEAEMANLIKDAKLWADTQKQKIIQYLNDNHESFPLYEYECGTSSKSSGGFHITAVGTKHAHGCGCNHCRYGHS